MTTTTPSPTSYPGPTPDQPRSTFWRVVLTFVVLGFAAFWIYALFFASKESINRIGDDAWAERAQGICEVADVEREALADFRVVDEDDPAMVAERGDLVDRATDIVEQMLDDVVAVRPTDPKGQELVPLWEADYRTYIEDRRAFADVLRTGDNAVFTEAAVDGIPISEKVQRFAADNHMPDCVPPLDTSN
ncbi:MAG: hypothetical protein ABW219_11130 [Ilumatobacteraceae bacterium]